MSDKVFIKNTLYRILFPLVSGSMIYILILMVFDSLGQLQENFFSQEALFTIILSYSTSESFVLLLRLLDRYIPFESGYRIRQAAQLSMTVMLNILVVSILVPGYFILIVGYSSFATEWIAFNLIFILFYVLINVYYLSHCNLYRHQVITLGREQQLRTNLDLELEAFKNDIHPALLFSCLESLIGLIGRDKKEADDYLMVLSRQYRYILDNEKNELLELDKEMDSLSEIVFLLNYRYQESIVLENKLPKNGVDGFLVPGTLSFIAEEIIFNTIINRYQSLKLIVGSDGRDTLTLSYRQNAVLNGENYNPGKMQVMNHTYNYFSGRKIELEDRDGNLIYNIPVISLKDEDSHN